ncbi:MAG: YggS family pyridoxal phosphate-dependent enzyme [Alphaproteobacteria bacterium]|nr:MAG: YggS family pyridoxal phosphate-dependent enzyme [Alphaproteobacteria bacterium]
MSDSQTHKTSDPKANLTEICARIETAAKRAGRSADEVSLIAVAKRQPPDRIDALLQAGHRVFGENRVQEAADKWPALKRAYPDVELHMVGPLQSNKAADAIALFDVIHSIDRMKLARKVAEEIAAAQRDPELFVQINTGEEPQKSGVMPRQADEFIRQCREELQLRISGLMCLPPIDEEASLHFALLAKIARRNGVENLSMGMSGDFETAIIFGATHIRVGTALFGDRDP